MHMPKTTVDENNSVECWEDEIRHAEQIIAMEFISQPEFVGDFVDGKLRSGVLPSDTRHILLSSFRSEYVGHFKDSLGDFPAEPVSLLLLDNQGPHSSRSSHGPDLSGDQMKL